MGGFYGYSPENFTPDNSIWAKVGGVAADTLMKIPEAIELEKTVQEGRLTNKDVYDATMAEIKGLDDNEVKTFFGRSKEELMKIGKPGRNEGAEYLVRNTKIFGDGLTKAMAKKNLNTAQGRIRAIGKNMDVADEVRGTMVDQTFKGAGIDVKGDLQKIGQSTPSGPSESVMPAIGNYASPEQVQSIASKNNVPLDQLQPEMSQASNRRDAQQLRQIDPSGTQLTETQRIGGGGDGIAPLTMSAIGTMPNQNQEASAIISAANSENDRYKAETDRMKAGNDATKEKRQSRNELINLKKTYQNEIKLAQTELSKLTDDLQKPAPLGVDEKTMKEWESTRKALVSRQKTLTRDLRNAKKESNEADKLLKQENGIPPTTYIDDEVWDAYDQVTSGSESDLPGMKDPQYKKQNEVYSIAEIANKTWGISISPEAISAEIKNGATPLQILQALFENSMGQ